MYQNPKNIGVLISLKKPKPLMLKYRINKFSSVWKIELTAYQKLPQCLICQS